MYVLRLSPVVISFLLLAARFYVAGQASPAGLCVVILLLLFLRQAWIPRLFQVLLVLGSLEWLRSLYFSVAMRIAFDQPWTRLVVILGTVALFTALSGLVFRGKALRQRYRWEGP